MLHSHALLVTDGHPGYPVFARQAGIAHEAVNLQAGVRVRSAIHVQNVHAYHSRLRSGCTTSWVWRRAICPTTWAIGVFSTD